MCSDNSDYASCAQVLSPPSLANRYTKMEWVQRKAAVVADSLGRTAERSSLTVARGVESANLGLSEPVKEAWGDAAARVDEFTGHSILSTAQLHAVSPLASWTHELHHTVAKLKLAGEKLKGKSLSHTAFQTAVRRVPGYREDCRETVVTSKWAAKGGCPVRSVSLPPPPSLHASRSAPLTPRLAGRRGTNPSPSCTPPSSHGSWLAQGSSLRV